MSFKELVLKNRSYRRFFENKKIEKEIIRKSRAVLIKLP